MPHANNSGIDRLRLRHGPAVSGTTVTFPLYIFGASQRGIRPDVNVLATMLFVLTVGAVLLAIWQQRRVERRLETTD